MAGIKRSEKDRARLIGLKHKGRYVGRKLSSEWREKVIKNLCRDKEEKHQFWKGGVSRHYYERIAKKLGYKSCQICPNNIYLEIHHINGNRKDNRLRNLSILCFYCHSAIHGKMRKNKLGIKNICQKKELK